MQWFQNFNCVGNEESVLDCPHERGVGDIADYCTHHFDGSVICKGNSSTGYFLKLILSGGEHSLSTIM